MSVDIAIMKADNKIKKTSSNTRISKAKFPIVGMGGSAGSFAAFEKFFNHMPADSGMAFVVIMHLSPDHKGNLAQLFQKFTAMPVIEANDGAPIEANKVFIIPPNKDIGVHNRKLLLLQPAKPNGYRQPIDYFLQSLADDQWNKSVGIILSGMGSDGETGIRMLKEKLGMAMVQDPQTAQYNSMPLAAIGTNLVDYVLAPEEMPLKLIQYVNHPVMVEDASDQTRSIIQDTNSIQKILMLLRTHTGHDFSLYKKSTITRRIDRRIAFYQLPDYSHYVNFLRENPSEIDVLFNELLIGVTKFFRDAPAFESLKERMCHLAEIKRKGDSLRVWIAGCSTGEEAYSIAMVLMECLDAIQLKKLKIQLFATDLDNDAIERARAGTYHENIVADVSAERLARFFVKKDGCYSVKKELREMIVFAQHNLIKDAPFTRLDLLCCRNVMIYLTSELQKKIMPIFYYALNNNGIMFMGPAETIGGFTEMFTSVDAKWKLFERRQGNVTTGKMFDFPFHVARTPALHNKLEVSDKQANRLNPSIAETYNRLLLENYAPASVLINDKGDILYSSGKTGRYLELPVGEAIMNIHRMAREGLKYVLGNIIHQVQTLREPVVINNIRIKEDARTRLVDLRASLVDNGDIKGLVMIVFDDKGLIKKSNRKSAADILPANNHHTEELQKELAYTKQQLNSTIEQMETSLEELKATNEELQSTNEELQSTNEESLTTKEEMQSLNEELMTINMQYQSKAEELTRLNNDMKNLLDATEIGTIFLDNNLDILRYTPQVRKLFNLIPTDVGRPIMHVVSTFDHPEMEQEIRNVIDQLITTELEVRTALHEWYKVRIMPYRTLDNFISGAVLTFSLITPYKQLEGRFNNLKQYTNTLLTSNSNAALQVDGDGQITGANQAFLNLFKREENQVVGHSFIEFWRPYWPAKTADKWFKAPTKTTLHIPKLYTGELELTADTLKNGTTGELLMMTIMINTLPGE
jgi:two-component system CheB/CheR fusion protein